MAAILYLCKLGDLHFLYLLNIFARYPSVYDLCYISGKCVNHRFKNVCSLGTQPCQYQWFLWISKLRSQTYFMKVNWHHYLTTSPDHIWYILKAEEIPYNMVYRTLVCVGRKLLKKYPEERPFWGFDRSSISLPHGGHFVFMQIR